MKAKRKVGKSFNVRKLVKHVKEWRLDTENMNKVIKKYPEKFKPEVKNCENCLDRKWKEINNYCKGCKNYKEKPQSEVKKSCENCDYIESEIDNAGYLQPCETCGDEYKNWEPKQEEVEVTIGFINEGNYDFEVMCSDNDRLRELIPKGSTQKFKLVRVEGR